MAVKQIVMRLKSCPRCTKGDQYYESNDKEWICLQCSHRVKV